MQHIHLSIWLEFYTIIKAITLNYTAAANIVVGAKRAEIGRNPFRVAERLNK